MQNKIATEHALNFILGGNAAFVLVNTQTDNRFAYKVAVSDKNPDLYYVCAYHNHTYLGSISHGARFYPKKGEEHNPLVIALEWFMRYLVTEPKRIPDYVFIYHMGTCCVCNRTLTDPTSVELGIGPECRKNRYPQIKKP